MFLYLKKKKKKERYCMFIDMRDTDQQRQSPSWGRVLRDVSFSAEFVSLIGCLVKL